MTYICILYTVGTMYMSIPHTFHPAFYWYNCTVIVFTLSFNYWPFFQICQSCVETGSEQRTRALHLSRELQPHLQGVHRPAHHVQWGEDSSVIFSLTYKEYTGLLTMYNEVRTHQWSSALTYKEYAGYSPCTMRWGLIHWSSVSAVLSSQAYSPCTMRWGLIQWGDHSARGLHFYLQEVHRPALTMNSEVSTQVKTTNCLTF